MASLEITATAIKLKSLLQPNEEYFLILQLT
jgi:hypothetical protein